MFALWSKFMVFLGLDEYTFSEVFDEEKVEEGKNFCKIGNLKVD